MDQTWVHLAFALSFVAFAFVHSLTADERFKRRAEGLLGGRSRHYRLAYSIFSVLTILPTIFIYAVYSPLSPLVYSVPGVLFIPISGVRVLSAIGMFVVLFQMEVLSFLGFKAKKVASGIHDTGLFAYVRHPIYTFLIIFVWARPVMVLMDLMAAILVTAYVIIGASFEEGRLEAEFGDAYLDYKKRVPMFIPKGRLW